MLCCNAVEPASRNERVRSVVPGTTTDIPDVTDTCTVLRFTLGPKYDATAAAVRWRRGMYLWEGVGVPAASLA